MLGMVTHIWSPSNLEAEAKDHQEFEASHGLHTLDYMGDSVSKATTSPINYFSDISHPTSSN